MYIFYQKGVHLSSKTCTSFIQKIRTFYQKDTDVFKKAKERFKKAKERFKKAKERFKKAKEGMQSPEFNSGSAKRAKKIALFFFGNQIQ